MKLRLVFDVEYDTHDVPLDELKANLEYMVRHALSAGLITGHTAAEVKTHEYLIRERPPVVIRDTLDGPGSGFVVAVGKRAAMVKNDDNSPVVFATEDAAQRCIVDYLADRVDECRRGERSFDDVVIGEYVQPVEVDEIGCIYDEQGDEFWSPTELE